VNRTYECTFPEETNHILAILNSMTLPSRFTLPRRGSHSDTATERVRKMYEGRRRIGLYGLSANPPTGLGGHLGVVRYLVSTGNFDEIWVLPVYRHMYRSKRVMEDFEHRVNMCAVSFPAESTTSCIVRVSELEKEVYEQQEASGTSDGSTLALLEYLKGRRSNDSKSWHLVLGSDTFNDVIGGKWKSSDRVLSMVDSVDVALRKGHTCIYGDEERLRRPGLVVHIHDIPSLEHTSSTLVREQLSGCGNSSDLHPQVAAYIEAHGLYQGERHRLCTRQALFTTLLAVSVVLFGGPFVVRWRGS